ncbi:MAG: hypothetical protein EBU82_08065 [Flavobacteriia bacterium]|nr:hypothetical protein [Flavobacteriia bacterium]
MAQDPVFAAFFRILQNSVSDKSSVKEQATQGLINQMRSSYNTRMRTGTFTDNILNLDTMSLKLKQTVTVRGNRYSHTFGVDQVPPHEVDEDGNKFPVRVPRGTRAELKDPKKRVEDVTYIGGGTYGEIWKSDTGRTFKRVIPQISKTDEELARNFYSECWIQTILSTDSTYGSSVSKILGMYRDEGIKKSKGQVIGDKLLFIEMEYIPYTFSSLVDRNTLTPQMLRGILIKVAEALLHFEKTYGFFHRDFHMGNLIQSYGMPGGDTVPTKVSQALGFGSESCASLDLFLFLMSIRDLTPEGSITRYIDSLTQISDGKGAAPLSTYDFMDWFTKRYVGKGAATWHSCYYWWYSDLERLNLSKSKGSRYSALDAILAVDVFKPASCIEKLSKEYSVTGIGLSNYFPALKYTRALLGRSISPNRNVATAISTLSGGGKRKTRRAPRKTRKGHRKH